MKYQFEHEEIKHCGMCPCSEFNEEWERSTCQLSYKDLNYNFGWRVGEQTLEIPSWCELKKIG
jgi:hypothetical protein